MNWNRLLLCCVAVALCSGATSAETEQLAAQTAAELIKRFDRDNDGRLSVEELREALAAGAVQPANTPPQTAPQTAKSTTDDDQDELKFIRVPRNEAGDAVSLDTSITSFQSPDGKLTVDLIGAVHVADRDYYQKLNREFRNYDVVLYELVAPEGTRIPRGGREQKDGHAISRIQRAIKSVLELSFQLEQIDYTAEHLVHADMSPEEFAKTMRDRGESFWKLLFRMMTQAGKKVDQKNAVSDVDLIVAFFAPDRSLRLKRVMATQFEDLENQMAVFEGPNGSTIITERNKKALSVLKKQLKLGHNKIGVFYGAGHMPDLAKRLNKDFGLEAKSTRWLKAWDLSK